MKKTERKKKEAPEKHKILRKLCALSLIKADDVDKAFSKIKNEYTSADAQKFFNYFIAQWLPDPALFCVHECKVRTNNAMESYHRTFNALLLKNPTLSKFFGKFPVAY